MGIRFRALCQWTVRDPLAFWAAVLPPLGVLFLASLLPGEPELHVRISGYLLTLFGIGLLLFGLRDTRKLFGKTSYKSRILAWLKRFSTIWRQHVVVAAGSASGMSMGGGATAIVRNVAKDNSISARLRAVEENLKRVDTRVGDAERMMHNEVQKLSASLTEELRKRDETTAALADRIEQFAAGSLDFALVGVVWAIVGQAFGTFPAEIGRYF